MAEANSSNGSRALRSDETTPDNRKLTFTPEMLSAAREFAAPKGVTKPETVEALAQLYIDYCRNQNHSRSNLKKLGSATQRLIAVAGDKHPDEVTVPMLEAARHLCVLAGVSRLVTNQYVRIMVMVFRWGHTRGYCEAETPVRLKLLEPLRKGRTEARDTVPRRPVPTPILKATLRVIRRRADRARTPMAKQRVFRLWSMMGVQMRTGMRPGEVAAMRWADLETEDRVWVYCPIDHKSAYRGIEREILIGPRAQRLLFKWREVAGELDPIFGVEGDAYREHLYRVLDDSGIPRFHPHQLRHGFATWINKVGDVRAAQILLGHQNVRTTSETYVDPRPDTDAARRLIGRIG